MLDSPLYLSLTVLDYKIMHGALGHVTHQFPYLPHTHAHNTKADLRLTCLVKIRMMLGYGS